MANRCYTEVAVFGEREELEKLYSLLCEFEKHYHEKHPEYKEYGIYERDFAESFGYKAKDKYDSNGWIEHYTLEDNCLRVYQGDRYNPRTYYWYHITRQFKTLDYVFFAQEPYMGVFQCTDDEHRFFKYNKYNINVSMMSDNYIGLRGRGNNEEELIENVNANCSTEFKSIEDIMRYYLSVPYDAMYDDFDNTFFIYYRNPWKEDSDPFWAASDKIQNEPGWKAPEPLCPRDEDDEWEEEEF